MKNKLKALLLNQDMLKKTNVDTDRDKYYMREELFKSAIKDFIKEYSYSKPLNFCDLSKNDFIELCCLVSTYRPIEPWQFLRDISMCNDARKERKNEREE